MFLEQCSLPPEQIVQNCPIITAIDIFTYSHASLSPEGMDIRPSGGVWHLILRRFITHTHTLTYCSNAKVTSNRRGLGLKIEKRDAEAKARDCVICAGNSRSVWWGLIVEPCVCASSQRTVQSWTVLEKNHCWLGFGVFIFNASGTFSPNRLKAFRSVIKGDKPNSETSGRFVYQE